VDLAALPRDVRKPPAFRLTSFSFSGEAQPRRVKIQDGPVGKAEPFRTSGGKAAWNLNLLKNSDRCSLLR
jgi:hypothetical protein